MANTCGSLWKSNQKIIIVIGVIFLVAAITVAIAIPLALNDDQVSKVTSLDTANAILTKVPIIDGHNDWPWQLRVNFKNAINNVSLYSDFTSYYPNSHTDIPRLRTGKVGAQFWACYARCSSAHKDAVRQALEQIDVIKRMVREAPDAFVFATTADEIEAANKDNKIASLIGVEGGHMIDSSLAALRMLFDLGARYMTLTHSCDTPWADASNQNYTNGGLTDFGKLVINEMNRLGMMIDLAHVSDAVMDAVLNITKAPIIFSHSSVRKLCDHVRNIPDDVLMRVKENNGIVMVNFFNDYVTCSKTANLSNVADHFDYIKSLIGADYIGIGADYDGVSRVPTGLEDVSKYPNLIAELLERGWKEDELEKIAGLNILRVMRKVENAATELQQTTDPAEEWIPDPQVAAYPCRTG